MSDPERLTVAEELSSAWVEWHRFIVPPQTIAPTSEGAAYARLANAISRAVESLLARVEAA